MAKRTLTSLLDGVSGSEVDVSAQQAERELPVTPSIASPRPESTAEVPGPASVEAQQGSATIADVPLYLKLTRKEARLRDDQINALTCLTRQLNRRRRSEGQRLTDNTLIRVAVDMLLGVADSLEGATEGELRQSVSTRLR